MVSQTETTISCKVWKEKREYVKGSQCAEEMGPRAEDQNWLMGKRPGATPGTQESFWRRNLVSWCVCTQPTMNIHPPRKSIPKMWMMLGWRWQIGSCGKFPHKFLLRVVYYSSTLASDPWESLMFTLSSRLLKLLVNECLKFGMRLFWPG